MIKNFRWWTSHVLPTVYDESLSYYEVLCKLSKCIADLAENVEQLEANYANIDETIEAIAADKVDEYLENLDIYDEIMQNLNLYFADVTDYGADNTGTSDSTAAFTAAVASGKGVIVVPPGRYIVNNLVIPSNRTVLGYGADLIATSMDGNQPNVLRNGNSANSSGYDGDYNITIEGLGFSAPTLNYCTLVAFGHANNIKILNCKFHDWNGWHGVEFNGVSNGIIDGCTFTRYGSTTGTYGEAVQLDYMHESAIFPWFGPYNDLDCENIKVINNTFIGTEAIRDNSTSAVNYLYSAIGSHTPREGFIRKILIDNNYIENFYNGIEFYDLYDSVISNNIIRGCYIGILLTHYIRDNLITGNNLKGIATAANHPDSWRGIAVYRPAAHRVSRENTITNNKISGFTVGISHQGFNSNISFNDISSCYMAAILCGIKEWSTQYRGNRALGSTGDSTHKSLTVNISDADDITGSGGLLIRDTIADYAYINQAVSSGSYSFVIDNQINGGITYGNITDTMIIFRNLVNARYNQGLRILKSTAAVSIEAQTWTKLADFTLPLGGVYLIVITATTTKQSALMSLQAYVPGNNVIQSIDTSGITGGRSAQVTLLQAAQTADIAGEARVWMSSAATINNWTVEIIDLAVSPK